MMKETEKNKEIFKQKYPLEMVIHNPLICAEAIGYLEALIEYLPSEEKWAKDMITWLVVMISYHKL